MWAWLKRAFGATTGICIPDQSQNVTLTPPSTLVPEGNSINTPVPLVGQHTASEGTNSSAASSPATAAAQDAQDKAAENQAASRAGRYIVSAKGMPIGIANTVSKYRETQPVRTHLTPFEQRVAAKLTEEQQIAAAAAATAAGDDDGRSDVSSVGPVPQQLFAATTAAGDRRAK